MIAVPEFRVNELTNFWLDYYYENLADIADLLEKEKVYGNMAICREGSVNQMEKLSKIWEEKSIIIVIGEGSRFVMVPELFGKVKEKQFYYSKAKDAWADYPRILKDVYKLANVIDDVVVLIALGPTATVLAYDLAQKGIRALDIGHIANVYERLTKGGARPEELPIVQ